MSHLKSYPKYKPSGVEWLGDVPEHWDVKRLRFLASYQNSNVDKKSYDEQQSVRLCNYTDVYYNESITDDLEFMEATASSAEIKSMTLNLGDVVITKDSENPSDIGIPAVVSEKLNNVVCGYHLTVIRTHGDSPARFLHRAIQAIPSKAQFHIESPGVTRFGLSQGAIGNLWIASPPPHEAEKITAFIDREAERIDALVEKKTRFIALLKEKRQALITDAVTGKFNVQTGKPYPTYRPSGVECLGDVPERWNFRKLGYECKLQGGYAFTASSFCNDGIPIIRMNNLNRGELDLSEVARMPETESNPNVSLSEGDLLWGMSGSTGATGSLGNFAVVRDVDLPCQLNQRVGRFVVNHNKIALSFLVKVVQSQYFYEQILLLVTGTAQFNVSSDQVQSCLVTLPTLEEQENIAAFLDRETGRIDALVEKTEKSIELLKERRSALITAAVTGKIDVRGSFEEREAPIGQD